MLTKNQVLRALDTTDETAKRLHELEREERAKQLKAVRKLAVRCSECKKSAPLHRWTFIQNRYYVRPSGCTEGDYWVSSLFEHCDMECPLCGKRNRINFRPDMEALIEIRKRTHFSDKELFDPQIVVESEPQTM